MKIDEIRDFVNKLNGYELSILNFWEWKRLDKEIIRYYNKYKKCDGDVIELPRHFKNEEELSKIFEVTKGMPEKDIELKGFKVNFFDHICGEDVYEILTVYSDDITLVTGFFMKQKIVEYFYEIEEEEIAREKAEKGSRTIH